MAIEAPPPEIARLWWGQIVAFVERINWAWSQTSGIWVTSWWRSPEKNRSVGGSSVSQHLVGLAADFVAPDPSSRIRFVADCRLAGLVPVDELTHVHVQLFQARVASASITATLRHISV